MSASAIRLGMTSVEETLSASLEACSGVISGYLFGSFAEARAHRDSDVDVAVLLDRRAYPTRGQRFDARVRLAAALEHDLAPRSPDIVILNDAPPTLAARIVSTGRRIVCRDNALEHAFRRDVQLRAADLQPFLRRTRKLKLHSILHR